VWPEGHEYVSSQTFDGVGGGDGEGGGGGVYGAGGVTGGLAPFLMGYEASMAMPHNPWEAAMLRCMRM
jgi:hypothetical protein